MKPTFTSIFSLNTNSFEKLYKELEIVLYHARSQNTSKLLKKLGYRLVFQHTSQCYHRDHRGKERFLVLYILLITLSHTSVSRET